MDVQGLQNAPNFHVILFQPEIPQNTGNIGRTCVALRSKLWIVRPTGFRLDSTQLKRAGLDYWQYLDWEGVDSWEELETRLQPSRFWLFTKFASKPYYRAEFQHGDALIFGSESSGLPKGLREKYSHQTVSIPMDQNARSLNLSVSVGVGLYEAHRQIAFS